MSILNLIDELKVTPKGSVKYGPLLDRIRREARLLELRSLNAPRGTVTDLLVSPPGAVYAAERAKQHELNVKNPAYVPPWNPGKEKGEDTDRSAGFAEVLKNPLLKPEVRLWLEQMAKEA